MTEDDINKSVPPGRTPHMDLYDDDEDEETTITSGRKYRIPCLILGILVFVALIIVGIVLLTSSSSSEPEVNRQINSPYFYQSKEDLTKWSTIYKLQYDQEKDVVWNKERSQKGFDDNFISTDGNNNTLIKYISFNFTNLDDHLMNIRITATDKARWEVPLFARDEDYYHWIIKFQHRNLEEVGFKVLGPKPNNEATEPFEFEIKTPPLYGKKPDPNAKPILSTEDCKLRYFSNFIELELKHQTKELFGLGDGMDFHLKNGTHTLFNRRNQSQSSSFPVYLNQLENKEFMGILIRNSNAQDYTIKFNETDDTSSVTMRFTGGIIDMYVFHSSDADYIIKKIHSVIGRPMRPPFWSLGFHVASQKYDTLDKLKAVVENYHQNALPLETLWGDTPLMQNGKSFTLNEAAFPNFKEYLADLETNHGIRFIPRIDACVHNENGYHVYENAKGSFIISNDTNQDFIGELTDGKCVYIDFFNDKAQEAWNKAFAALKDKFSFAGVWLTTNEVYNECDGECADTLSTATSDDGRLNLRFLLKDEKNQYENLVYVPNGLQNLKENTISMNAKHRSLDESLNPFLDEFNTHNLYGLTETIATSNSLQEKSDELPFIVSESTFLNSGKFGAHNLDGYTANEEGMKQSIAGLFSFNLFGIPMVGADICGNNVTEVDDALCARWFQLGSFYPFMRQYTRKDSPISTEPYLEAFPKTLKAAKGALAQRYSLLRFLYTTLFQSYLWGGTAVEPLLFEFPRTNIGTDDKLYHSMLIGKSILAVPNLKKSDDMVTVYLPNWNWYEITPSKVQGIFLKYDETKKDAIIPVVVDWKEDHMQLFVKGGSIIPVQDALKVLTTKGIEQSAMTIQVYPDHEGGAVGYMIAGNGQKNTDRYRHYNFVYGDKILKINQLHDFEADYPEEYEIFDSVKIFPTQPKFGEVNFACFFDNNMNVNNLTYSIVKEQEDHEYLILHEKISSRTPLYEIESVTFGGPDDQNLCQASFNLTELTKTDTKWTGELTLPTPNNKKLPFLFQASLKSDDIMRLQIKPSGGRNFHTPPENILSDQDSSFPAPTKRISEYTFATSETNDHFHFQVHDQEHPEEMLISSKYMPILITDKFVHFRLTVNAERLFGLGERVHNFTLEEGLLTLFARDIPNPKETGKPPGNNVYGVHPFLMYQCQNPSKFGGLLFFNNNPMDIQILKSGSLYQIDFRVNGGIIDLLFITPRPALDLIKRYHTLIGKPPLLPYWSFGFHLCRYGWPDEAALRGVVKNMTDNAIPLDTMWTDIEYMYKYRDFTLDLERYPNMTDFVNNELHAKNMYFVPITDTGIGRGDYDIYNQALASDLFIKSAETGEALVGMVWPGFSSFLDFNNPAAFDFWRDQFEPFKEILPYDGMWIDMNEAANFCTGECPDEAHYLRNTFNSKSYNRNLYIAGHRDLCDKGIAMDAYHGKDPDFFNTEYNWHSVYGHEIVKSTHLALKKMRMRPFIITRSTFVGTGRFGSHWLGDNHSTFDYLKFSIPGVMNTQMFGMPFAGADICGFIGDTTEELCRRWIQLGIFYPFVRNHNDKDAIDQEPYRWPDVQKTFKEALEVRYSLIRYIYSLHNNMMIEEREEEGRAFFKPLFYEYPTDKKVYEDIDGTFLVGDIKVSPIMNKGQSKRKSYFPNENWYPLFTGSDETKPVVIKEFRHGAEEGKYLDLEAPLTSAGSGTVDRFPIHIRAGAILTYQNAHGIMNTAELVELPVHIRVYPNLEKNQAYGVLFYDDGISVDSYTDNKFTKIDMNYDTGKLRFNKYHENSYKYDKNDGIAESIAVYGFQIPSGASSFIACAKKDDATIVMLNINVDQAKKLATVTATGSQIVLSDLSEIIISTNPKDCQQPTTEVELDQDLQLAEA